MAQPAFLSPRVTRTPLALLVDRDDDTRQMYATYLQYAYEVEEAQDGREGLAKALTHHPDVVVTETRLPGMTGFDLCRILRGDEQTRRIPIVFLSGDAFPNASERAEACGADAFLVKPCLPERLAAEIRRVLEATSEALGRAGDVRARAMEETRKADTLLERSREAVHRAVASRAFHRQSMTEPPIPPVSLVCPACDRPLQYMRSHVGGVSERHAEQWDYFECTAGCGTFQYRHRTRKLRRVSV
jgi:two-component system, cell cycle response regulator DivK